MIMPVAPLRCFTSLFISFCSRFQAFNCISRLLQAMASVEKKPNEGSTYPANCHCGAVAYDVKLPAPLEEIQVMSCNCSHCFRCGYLLVYPKKDDVTWRRGFDNLREYQFGFKTITHLFCKTCGSSIGFDMTGRKTTIETPPGWGMNVSRMVTTFLKRCCLRKID